MKQPDAEVKCPGCEQLVGDHTIRGYAECLDKAGFNYELPHEEIPGGPISFPGLEGSLAGEVTVSSGVLDSAIGPVPCLQFRFAGPGIDPMERVQLPPVTLVMDDNGLQGVARLVRNAVKMACAAARRRASGG